MIHVYYTAQQWCRVASSGARLLDSTLSARLSAINALLLMYVSEENPIASPSSSILKQLELNITHMYSKINLSCWSQ